MALWGKTGVATDKPKYLTTAQKANTALTAEGWVYTQPGGLEEVLIAMGNPNLGAYSTVAPVVSGTLTATSTLTSTNGTWVGSPAFTRQWQVADTAAGPFTDIAAATGATYVLTVGNVGKFIRSIVTGTNGLGATSMNSNIVGPVA